jgi:hypothetical protein
MSDSAGYIYDAEGLMLKVSFVMELKNELRGRISYVEKYPNAKYIAGNVHGSKM